MGMFLIIILVLVGLFSITLLTLGPRRVIQLGMRCVARLCYRIDAVGLERIPHDGPALVVANHVSWVDAFVLGSLCSRPVRFVMDRNFYQLPVINLFWRVAKAIPITSRRRDLKCFENAMDSIDQALASGEVVIIFPEGRVTRDGEVDSFRPGVDMILARRPVNVIPVALRGLWGSMFSFQHGPPLRSLPRRFRAKVEVICGDAISATTANAAMLQLHVTELRGAVR